MDDESTVQNGDATREAVREGELAARAEELVEAAQAERRAALSPGSDCAASTCVPSDDDIMTAFLEWAEARGTALWPHQEEAVLSLLAGEHVILGTPTGSGKTLVALALQFKALVCAIAQSGAGGSGVQGADAQGAGGLGAGGLGADGLGAGGRSGAACVKSYYTAPIKALVNEKYLALAEFFGQENVGLITGDVVMNPEAPLICCTAEILAYDALREGAEDAIRFVTMDEFHYFGEYDRGWAWHLPLLTLPNAQFLLMSATLGDMKAVRRLLEDKTGAPVTVIDDAPRPVPLVYSYVETALESTVELALREGKGPLYVVHFSQKEAFESAKALASYGIAGKEQRDGVRRAIRGFDFSTAFGAALERLLGCGVGVHHAGMLPRYRMLVERLAQQGLLPVICGTDTLGVGINVPIRTVLVTALVKFDGRHMRRLKAREFHQIAGRAGRSGFDTQGDVVVQAPEHEIENAKIRAKCAGDEKKLRKQKLKRPKEGAVSWDKRVFEKLVAAPPETLKARMKITLAMVLQLAERGSDLRAAIARIVEDSLVTDEEKTALLVRAEEAIVTLVAAGVLLPAPGGDGGEDGACYAVAAELPENFALDQPLSPFLISAIDLLDPEEEGYASDLVSLAEAIVPDPKQLLIAQERRARSAALAEMKRDGVPWEEQMERIEDISYPRPLADELAAAFASYCEAVPWAADFEIAPKSVVREMIEGGHTFKSYVAAYGISGFEGIFLRYLNEVFRVLDRTVPYDACTDEVEDIISWLYTTIRRVDGSVFESMLGVGAAQAAADGAGEEGERELADRRSMRVLVRNALFRRVVLASLDKAAELGELDRAAGFGERDWRGALDAYYAEHEFVRIDADARSAAYFELDESHEESEGVWHARQLFLDEDGDCDFRIEATVDVARTRETAEATFTELRAFSLE